MIFKAVRDDRPYPEHGLTTRDWTQIPPTQVALDQLVTTKKEMDLGRLLDDDSTFYGDLFAHVVEWQGELYLEDGLHRALRSRCRAGRCCTPGCCGCLTGPTSTVRSVSPELCA